MHLHKKLCAVAAAALAFSVFASVPAAAETLAGLRSDSCVADNANILNSDTETYITNLTVALQEACGAQIGVYTTEYIGNDTMEGYAYEVFQAWGLGSSSEDNGLLLLLATGEDNYWATPGEGLENAFTGSTLSDLLYDNLESSWVKQDYDTGTRKTVLAMSERIADYYNLNLDLDAIAEGRVTADGTAVAQPQKKSSGIGGMLVTVLILTAVVFLLIALLTRPRGPRGPRGPRVVFYSSPRPRRRRRSPPPPRGGPGPGGFGGNPGGPRPGGGSFHSGGGASRGGGAGRSFSGGSRSSGSRSGGARRSGGSFRSGGGSSRGGGAGRRR